jgi:WD40 repeat protein
VSPGARSVAIAAKDGLYVYDRSSGRLAVRSRAPVRAVVFSADGRSIVTGGYDGALRVWDRTGTSPPHTLGRMPGRVVSVALSLDGRFVAAGGERSIQIWDVRRRRRLATIPTRGEAWGLAFSGDRRLAAGSEDGPIRIYTATGELIIELAGVRGRTAALAWAPEQHQLASAAEDGTTQVWDDGGAVAIRLGRGASVNSVSFSADGRRLAAASDDGRIYLIDATGRQPPVLIGDAGSPVDSIEFHPAEPLLLTADEGGKVRLWQARANGRTWTLERRRDAVYTASFDGRGDRVVSAGEDGRVRVTIVRRGEGSTRTAATHSGAATGAVLNPDGTLVASAGVDGRVRISHVDSSRRATIVRDGGEPASTVAFSSDGRRVVAGALDGSLTVWRIDGTRLHTLRGHATVVWSATFNPAGTSILSGAEDGLRLWDAHAGTSLVFRGLQGDALDVAYSPVADVIAAAGEDGTVRIWPCPGCGPIERVVARARKR